MTNTLESNAIVCKVIENFGVIGSTVRNYDIEKIPKITVTDDNPNTTWRSSSSRMRSRTNHTPKYDSEIRIPIKLIQERARLLDPRPSNIFNNILYTIEGLNKTTAEQRVGVATAVLTLEAITSSHRYDRPTEEEYSRLAALLDQIGYSAKFGKRQN